MTKKIAVAGLGALVAALSAGVVLAEEGGVTAGLDLTAASQYIWRGQVLQDDPVVQPSLTVAKNGLSINVWGNFNTSEDYTGEREMSEYDLTVSYATTCPLTGAGVTVGVIDYSFPNQTLVLVAEDGTETGVPYPGTREAFLTYGLSSLPLAPTLSVYYDFDEAEGFYGNFGVSHSFELFESASLALAGSVGYASKDYNAFYFGVEEDMANDGNISAALPVKLSDSLTLKPMVAYTVLLEDDIKDGAEGIYLDTEALVGSVTLSYAF